MSSPFVRHLKRWTFFWARMLSGTASASYRNWKANLVNSDQYSFFHPEGEHIRWRWSHTTMRFISSQVNLFLSSDAFVWPDRRCVSYSKPSRKHAHQIILRAQTLYSSKKARPLEYQVHNSTFTTWLPDQMRCRKSFKKEDLMDDEDFLHRSSPSLSSMLHGFSPLSLRQSFWNNHPLRFCVHSFSSSHVIICIIIVFVYAMTVIFFCLH